MGEFRFKPASEFTERHGLFVALIGGTNSGKTYSALRLARGIAGPNGKIVVLDTEGGRTLHLKEKFRFDYDIMDPPHRPHRYATGAKEAEDAGYDALVIDSFSMEWVGLGGVLDWQESEFKRLGGKDSARGASWIEPKKAHKAMVYALLQRRIPIVFSIRGEETFVPPSTKTFKAVTNKAFPFEVTVSFRLESDRKGFIDLTDPKSWKMEEAHEAIFRHGDRISEEHGAALAAWARGAGLGDTAPPPQVQHRSTEKAPRLWTAAKAKVEADGLEALRRSMAAMKQPQIEYLEARWPELEDIEAARLATLDGLDEDIPDDVGDEPRAPHEAEPA